MAYQITYSCCEPSWNILYVMVVFRTVFISHNLNTFAKLTLYAVFISSFFPNQLMKICAINFDLLYRL